MSEKKKIIEKHVMREFSKMVKQAHAMTTDGCVYMAPFPFKASESQPDEMAELLWKQKDEIIELFKLLNY